ncbi:hypothetical protein B0H13DRAFT_2338373 [Mycena leptocephala]|nr:hypothetical protein B0H13DRAFT_2338373 [Mycena leptocephala]
MGFGSFRLNIAPGERRQPNVLTWASLPRRNLLPRLRPQVRAPDGGFESFTACDDFCFAASYANWMVPAEWAVISTRRSSSTPTLRTRGTALLGAAFGDDSLPGTLTPAAPLMTENGVAYVVQCFMSSTFSGPQFEAPPRSIFCATVCAWADDLLSFVGGAAPAWTFIDDCKVYKA